MRPRLTILTLALLCTATFARAQQTGDAPASRPLDTGAPAFAPTARVGRVMHQGDSLQLMELSSVYVYPTLAFKNERQANQYMRLVRNVKKVLPLAKQARQMLIETSEVLETLPTKKAKEEHMKRVEADILRVYKPQMKKLTYSQGKLLIKLIHRETNSSGYEAIQAFLGPVRAGFWQVFAWTFGASLKKEYDAEGTDRLTERVVLMVEAGQL